MGEAVEPDGFTTYVRARQHDLLRTAWLLTGDWAAAEDLLQNALVKVLPRWDSIRDRGAVDAYVRRVVMTTFLAGRARRWRFETPVERVPDLPVGTDLDTQVGDRAALLAALRTLPTGQRAVVVLRHVLDLSEADTADALGCSVGTVKSQNARALTTLRRIIGSADPSVEVG